jgi:tetratricopeptide (TPR) repeat protein
VFLEKPFGELQDSLADGAHLAEVPLQPLDVAAMTELVASLQLPQLDAATLAPQLVRHTGGNPLFALETLKAHLLRGPAEGGVLPRPINVGTLIARRLRQLSAQALALARVAAVAGTDFDIAAAEAVLGAHTLALADAWAELEAAQVLRDGGFAHDLVQDAVLQGLPQPVAQRLHAQLAQHLQTRELAEPARVAAHWQAAGEPLAAVPWLVRASERAQAGLQQIVAGDLLLAAAQALASAGRRGEAFDLLQRCAELWLDFTDAERALALRERMLALAEGDAQQARAHLMDARVHELAGRMAEMRLSAERALVPAQRCGDLALQARGLDFLASEAYWGGRVAEALPLFERMRGLWSTLGRLSELTRCNYAIGVALGALGRLDEADANFEGAAVQLASIADWATLVQLLRERALMRITMGQRAQAAAFLQQALQVLDRLEPSAELACAPTALLARVLRRGGHYVDALALLDGFEARFAQHRTSVFWDVPLERAALLLELGRPHLALQAMAPLAALPQPSPTLRYRLQQLRLWLREAGTVVADDDPDVHTLLPPLLALAVQRAAARLKPAAQRAPELQALHALALQRNQRAEALGLQAECVLALHDAGRADEAAALALPLAEALATADALIYPPAAWWAVHLALAAPHPDLAAAALARATDWLAQAVRQQVPEALLKSFVERNPVNRCVLAAARQHPAAMAAARAVLRAAGQA